MPAMLAFSNELKQSSEVRKQKQSSFAISQNNIEYLYVNLLIQLQTHAFKRLKHRVNVYDS